MRFLQVIVLLLLPLFCGSLAADDSSSSFSPLLVRSRALNAASRIKHIVVLMMENRSFDHLLGWLHDDYSSDIDGLSKGSWMPRNPNDPSSGDEPITRNGYDEGPDDPIHTFDGTTQQINSNEMNGFVYSALTAFHNLSNPVAMFDSSSAPIVNTLAKEFAVFDRWFCSIPGPTDPNRGYAMAGTSHGMVTNFDGNLWSFESYFHLLNNNNRSFSAYYQDDLWAVMYFEDMHQPEQSQYVYEFDQFFTDVSQGKLAQYVWLQPRMTTHDSLPTWQHPDASVREGERLIKSVYEALRSSPLWNDTLFLITYDEHGGFADHVPPPSNNIPSGDDIVAPNGFKFDRLGVRIPTIAISPWIKKGKIIHDYIDGEKPTASSAFDSTSIQSTVHHLLGLEAEGIPMLGNRAPWANTFLGLLTELETPRDDCPLTLPYVPPADDGALARQKSKALNEHLEEMLIFYCVQHYSSLHEKDLCPIHHRHVKNQGEASVILKRETEVFMTRLREKERLMKIATI